ncbi:Stk1 family PASTA domain-containing Ser/Thr kinase [Lachnoclostridium sp. Marseille-P6806]|uniref:Stk1 family PASTA domain-containing Ser/Thr kinase n=1 Tax=Lachnoclostridium sp. Marseille-P6806 TaxID=2364793 RepID=UPI001031B5FC|nr:Stk1 family PASTA domain-containing Ser/Thr kinase [Lachnoclostridium sp. Marseille-P6806]
MIKIGMLIADRYEVLEKIGTGGMSDVYKAKDHKLNRFVAVKVMKQEFADNANFVSKFRVEAQAAAGLMHPNIVNVYDVGEEKGVYYIVMELVDGITLKKYIEKKARLSVREAVSIAIQVSMGLDAAHRNHVIHRDIKPQNIIISKDGKVKVTDFGIAKAATSNTITSNVMGSVHYTSPEQARGGYSDEKSDIYSLGITLFEMLTGRVPFNGETTVAIAIKHIQQPMPSPCGFVPEIPRSVEQIVLKCCEKSPDRRYQSMPELIADLKESLLHPEEDFVQRVDPDEESATRMATERDRRDIRGQYDRRPERPAPEELDDPEEIAPRRPREGRPRSAEPMRLERDVRRRYEKDDYGDDFNDDEDDYSPRMERLTTILSVLAALLIGLVIIFLAGRAMGFWGNASGTDDTRAESGMVVFPDGIVGKDVETAKTELENLGLVPQVIYAQSSEYESGKVISASAEAGAELASGTAVELTVSAGTDGTMVDVPDVKGQDKAVAKSQLAQKGFKVNVQELPSADVEAGIVISQDPEGNSTALSGTVVTITVSSGEDTTGKVAVPTLTGMTEEDAMALLVESGLALGEVTEVDSDDNNLKGLVTEQSEKPRSYVEEGTKVNITVVRDKAATYSYSGDIAAPSAAENPNYRPGTPVYVVIIAADGTTLLNTTYDSFPQAFSILHVSSATATLQMTWAYTADSTVTTDPSTGAAVTAPGGTSQQTITRALTFTPDT